MLASTLYLNALVRNLIEYTDEPPKTHRCRYAIWKDRMDRLFSYLPPSHEYYVHGPIFHPIDLNPKPDNQFKVMLNVQHFQPGEIVVKAVDGEARADDDKFIVVHCKHEEDADEHGLVSREFTRRYKIPEDVESSKLTASLSKNGVLEIQAPRKIAPLPENGEITVPITIQTSGLWRS